MTEVQKNEIFPKKVSNLPFHSANQISETLWAYCAHFHPFDRTRPHPLLNHFLTRLIGPLYRVLAGQKYDILQNVQILCFSIGVN